VNLDRVEKIAEAVLYEGYMLYPYRHSSVKNQQRWNFGVLYPQSWCDGQSGSDAFSMQTECLVRVTDSTRLTVKIRFLQIVQRLIGKVNTLDNDGQFATNLEYDLVDRLEVDGRVYLPCQEAVEQQLTYAGLDPFSLASLPCAHFTFPQDESVEYIQDERGSMAGAIVRQREALRGSVQLSSECLRDGIVRVRVQVHNLTPMASITTSGREAVLMYSLVSAHTILGAETGEFVSLLEPPPDLEDLATHCNNTGTWPVLIGETSRDRADIMLSSPIILYDYPQIAPESAGNLFDSTEIDEILSLRILTLTDDEKREMRQSDDRTRAILERTEAMPDEQFMKLHGVLRGLSPAKEEIR
jgi:hydrogenase maturation protease